MDSQNKDSITRIVIIGGGLSGLTAAQHILLKLSEKGKPHQVQVTVLEAMDRVGGRTLTIDYQGTKFDLGGQWVGKTQKFVQQLAFRSNNHLYNQYHQGTKILHLNNHISTYKTDIPFNVGIFSLIQLQIIIWKIDRMAKKVNIQNPRQCKQGLYWDSLTILSWLNENCYTRNVKKLFQCVIRAIFGGQVNQISFLFLLWYVHQSSGIQNLININNGLQQKKMINGSQYLSEFLAKNIMQNSGSVKTGVFIKKIDKLINKDGKQIYNITDKKNNHYQADMIIIATPPSCVAKIDFYPQLSRQRRFINERSFMGSCSKVILLYKQAYWRQRGYSGQTLSDCIQTPVFNAYDDCRTKDNGEIQPALLVFINAQVDRQWSRDKIKSQKIILQTICSYFGDQRLLSPDHVIWKVWNEEQSLGGAPVSLYPPGVLSKIQNIRKPEGNIHWAGTQMATISQGFMDGAIQSGKRCAEQVLDKIFRNSHSQIKKEPISLQYSKIITPKKQYFEWW